MIFSILV